MPINNGTPLRVETNIDGTIYENEDHAKTRYLQNQQTEPHLKQTSYDFNVMGHPSPAYLHRLQEEQAARDAVKDDALEKAINNDLAERGINKKVAPEAKPKPKRKPRAKKSTKPTEQQ